MNRNDLGLNLGFQLKDKTVDEKEKRKNGIRTSIITYIKIGLRLYAILGILNRHECAMERA